MDDVAGRRVELLVEGVGVGGDRRVVDGGTELGQRHEVRRQPGEDRDYIRFAYSGISEDRIREGLGKLKDWIESK